jgi:hypothetical protein
MLQPSSCLFAVILAGALSACSGNIQETSTASSSASSGSGGDTVGSGECFQCAAGQCPAEVATCEGSAQCKSYQACIEACPPAASDPLAPTLSCLGTCQVPSDTQAQAAFSALAKCLDEQDNAGAPCATACL